MLKAVSGGSGGGGGTVTSVAGTTNRITATGTTSVVIDIAATYVGQTSITTLGTIVTGVWNGGAVASTGAVSGTNLSGTNTGDQTTSGTSNRITVSTGSTNPVIDISSSYVGQNTITTLGTIVTGTWAAGTVNGLTLASQAVGFTIAGGTSSKTLTVPLDATVSGTNTGNQTTAGTSNRIDVTNGSTSPVVDISATYVGQASITTVGTITTGVWNAGAVTSSGNINYVGQAYNAPQTLTDQATVAWNMNSGGNAIVTITASRTMGAPTNIQSGGTYLLEVVQGGAGSFTIAWNGVFKWPGAAAPTLSTAAGAKDIISFYSPDGTNLFGVAQLGFA